MNTFQTSVIKQKAFRTYLGGFFYILFIEDPLSQYEFRYNSNSGKNTNRSSSYFLHLNSVKF